MVEVHGSKGFKGFQTEVVEDNSNPVWNKSGKLVLYPQEVLSFTVMDRDAGDADDFLGKVSLPVAKVLPNGFEGELQLQDTGKATSFLMVRSKVLRPLHDPDAVADALKLSQGQAKRPPPPRSPKVHEIELIVKAAKRLRNADWSFGGSGASDAYVVVSVPGTKTEFQTPVIQDSCDPEWNFTQKLFVAPKETLLFKVFDQDRSSDDFLGSASLAVSGIVPNGFSGSLKLEDRQNPTDAELLLAIKVLRTALAKDMIATAKAKAAQAGPALALAYTVELTVLSASGLRNADWGYAASGNSDAYCVVEVHGSKGFKGFQTEVVEDNSNPVWNKSGKLVLYPQEVLSFTVMDRDAGDADDFLGKVSLPVAKVLPNGFEGELQLQDTGKATSFLMVRSKVLRPLHDPDAVADALKLSQGQAKRPPPPRSPKVHEIELIVKAAKRLRNADWSFGGSGASDAYVVVSVPGTKTEFQTPVIQDSCDPEWNFTQKLFVAPKETLLFKVFDQDRSSDDFLGSASLAVSGIVPNGFSGSLKLEDRQNPTDAELLLAIKVLRTALAKDMIATAKAKAAQAGPALALAYTVELTVLSASGLRNADWGYAASGNSDAYCVVEVHGSKGFKGFQTEVVEDNSNPVWNKSGKLVLYPQEVLSFTVMDRDAGDADDFLGKVSLPVAKVLPNGFEGELQLQDTGKATSFLMVRSKVLRPLHDPDAVADALKLSQGQAKRPPPPRSPKVHEIELIVKAAKRLRNADWSFGGSGASDAYVVVSVPGTKTEFQTPVIQDSCDPEWNFTQKLFVAPKETLLFKVFDQDRSSDDFLGSASLAVSGIVPNGFSGSLKLEDRQNPTDAELLVVVRVFPVGAAASSKATAHYPSSPPLAAASTTPAQKPASKASTTTKRPQAPQPPRPPAPEAPKARAVPAVTEAQGPLPWLQEKSHSQS